MICQRCLKNLPDKPDGAGIHTCTPSKLVRELEQQRDEYRDTIAQQAELLAAHKDEMQDWQRQMLSAQQQRDELLDILQDLREWNGDLVLRDYIDAAIAEVNLLHALPSTELREPPREAFK